MSIESVMPSNHLILCLPLLLLPSIFPSIRVFSNESALRIRWPEYWSFSFSISPSNEYSGPISFRMDRFGDEGYRCPFSGTSQWGHGRTTGPQDRLLPSSAGCGESWGGAGGTGPPWRAVGLLFSWGFTERRDLRGAPP